MPIVCLDTQILYWAVVKKAVPGAEKLISLASDFVKWLDSQPNTTIIVPTIVVGEMLIPVPEDEHPKVLAQFRQDWMIVEYDLKAASIFAKLRREHITQKRFKDLRNLHPDTTKKELVADAMIIATAIAHGAEKLYSHNKDLRALAEGFIPTASFEDETFQRSLPE
jgi:predicted nucleic acid-binding protein